MTQQPNLDPFGSPYTAPPHALPTSPATRHAAKTVTSLPAPAGPLGGDTKPSQGQAPASPPEAAPEGATPPVTPAKEAGEEKPAKKRGTGLAYDGSPVMVSDEEEEARHLSFPGHPGDYSPTDEEVSFEDLGDINRQINRARVALFRGTQILAQTKREEADKEFLYKRAFNRALLKVSGGTEKTRVTTASLQTEDEWGEYMVAQRVAEEATNHLRAIRSELDALAGLSHNIRAQMNVM